METAPLAALPQKPLRQPQKVPTAESAAPGQKFLAAASSKKKLNVRNFPPKFSGPGGNGNRAAGGVAPKAAKAAAGSSCCGVGCSGPEIFAGGLVKTKIKRPQFSPQILWTWRQWKQRRWRRCRKSRYKLAAGSSCRGVGCSGPEILAGGLVKKN